MVRSTVFSPPALWRQPIANMTPRICVRAVGAARDIFMKPPVEGSAATYCAAVLAALEPVFENYNDRDGTYRSGKSSIGNVYADIMGLLSEKGAGLIDGGADMGRRCNLSPWQMQAT